MKEFQSFPYVQHRGKSQGGFIALISSIILSIILLGLTVRVSSSNFSARANALQSEFKSISVALARSCSQITLLRLSQEYWYSPEESGDVIHINGEKCTIIEINHEVEDANTHRKKVMVTTESSYRGAFTTLYTEILMTNPSFMSISSPPVSLIRMRE